MKTRSPFLPDSINKPKVIREDIPVIPVGPQGSISSTVCQTGRCMQHVNYEPSDWFCCPKPGVEKLRKCCPLPCESELSRPITKSEDVLSTDASISASYFKKGRYSGLSHPITRSEDVLSSDADFNFTSSLSFSKSELSRPITRSSQVQESDPSLSFSFSSLTKDVLDRELTRSITRSSQVLPDSSSEKVE